MNPSLEDLNDFPAELAETIRDIYQLVERFVRADSGRASENPLWPRTRNYFRARRIYDERFVRLREKFRAIPEILPLLRSIDRHQQPRLYASMVEVYLDFFKYDIDNPVMKTGLRRMIERLWKRLSGNYLGGWRGY